MRDINTVRERARHRFCECGGDGVCKCIDNGTSRVKDVEEGVDRMCVDDRGRGREKVDAEDEVSRYKSFYKGNKDLEWSCDSSGNNKCIGGDRVDAEDVMSKYKSFYKGTKDVEWSCDGGRNNGCISGEGDGACYRRGIGKDDNCIIGEGKYDSFVNKSSRDGIDNIKNVNNRIYNANKNFERKGGFNRNLNGRIYSSDRNNEKTVGSDDNYSSNSKYGKTEGLDDNNGVNKYGMNKNNEKKFERGEGLYNNYSSNKYGMNKNNERNFENTEGLYNNYSSNKYGMNKNNERNEKLNNNDSYSLCKGNIEKKDNYNLNKRSIEKKDNYDVSKRNIEKKDHYNNYDASKGSVERKDHYNNYDVSKGSVERKDHYNNYDVGKGSVERKDHYNNYDASKGSIEKKDNHDINIERMDHFNNYDISKRSIEKKDFPLHSPFVNSLSHIFTERPSSAPPTAHIFSGIEKETTNDLFKEIEYNAYYRRNSRSDIRLPVPRVFISGSEYIDCRSSINHNKFMKYNNSRNLVETIDTDFPSSNSISLISDSFSYKRSDSPIGDHPFLREIVVNKRVEYKSYENEIVKDECYEFMNDMFEFYFFNVKGSSKRKMIYNSSYNEDNTICKINNDDVKVNKNLYNDDLRGYNDSMKFNKNIYYDNMKGYNEDMKVNKNIYNEDIDNIYSNTRNHNNNIYSNTTNNSKNISSSLVNNNYICPSAVTNNNICPNTRNNSKNISSSDLNNNYIHSNTMTNNNICPSDVNNNYIHSNTTNNNLYVDTGLLVDNSMNDINIPLLLSLDQEGSRFIQNKINICSINEIEWFYHKIKDDLKRLCIDLFGNYVVQKLLEYGLEWENNNKYNIKVNNEINETFIDDMISSIHEYTIELCMHMYGCRVIQKVMEHNKGIHTILDQITEYTEELLSDQNGNHVLQKTIELLNKKKIKNEHNKDTNTKIQNFTSNLVNLFINTNTKYIKHRYGCRVIQRMFENSESKYLENIIEKCILNDISSLLEDQYGNYVLQHIIVNCSNQNKYTTKNFSRIIINKIREILNTQKFIYYSCHKFASNVIEKCVIHHCENTNKKENEEFYLFDSFISQSDTKKDNKMVAIVLATDRYANYVIQRMIEKGNAKLISIIKCNIGEIKGCVYSRHIINKIIKGNESRKQGYN